MTVKYLTKLERRQRHDKDTNVWYGHRISSESKFRHAQINSPSLLRPASSNNVLEFL